MVTPSLWRRNLSSRDSSAERPTLAVEMVSNAWATGGIGPPGRFSSALQRASSSLQPPQPGTMPTPTSTRPI